MDDGFSKIPAAGCAITQIGKWLPENTTSANLPYSSVQVLLRLIAETKSKTKGPDGAHRPALRSATR
jgi:hypothetical protein